MKSGADPWAPGCDPQRVPYAQEGPLIHLWDPPHRIQILTLRLFSRFPRASQKASSSYRLCCRGRAASPSLVSAVSAVRFPATCVYHILYARQRHCPARDITSEQDAGAALAWVLHGPCSPSAAPLVPAAGYKQARSGEFCAKTLGITVSHSGKPWSSLSITLPRPPAG